MDNTSLGVRKIWVSNPGFTTVILPKLLNTSKPQFSRLENGDKDIYFMGLLKELKVTM